jgi:cytosine/adenosine deaminase-related metal-dependent hydrolase
MIINCQILSGKGFEHIQEAHLRIEGNRITEVSDGFISEGIDLRNLLAAPALINAHTHIGDSFAKEACIRMRVNEAVGRKGKKWQLYEETPKKKIIQGMRDSATDMLNCGTGCLADFREGGAEGIRDLRVALEGIPIKAIALGRDLDKDGFESSDGIGLNTYQLNQVPSAAQRKNKIIAIHAGELDCEIEQALEKNPDIIIHFTRGSEAEAKKASKKGVSVVLCPRANSSLRVGFPPARMLFDSGANVCLGTDNVMINSPDLWREMEYLYKFSLIGQPLEAKEIFSAATVNCAKALRQNSGFIGKNRDADIIFIDTKARNLRDTSDLLATIVTRCRPENIREVMIQGNFITGRMEKDISQ